MNRTVHEFEAEEVMAYLDGELEASRASEIAAHIAGCGECAAVATDLRGVSNRLADWGGMELPETALNAMERAFDSARCVKPRANTATSRGWMRRWFWGRPWRVAGALATAGVLAIASTTVFLRERGVGQVNYIVASREPAPAYVPRSYSVTMDQGAGAALKQRQAEEQLSENLEKDPDSTLDTPAAAPAPVPGPMIARTAEMTLVVVKLDDSRAALEKLLARHHGFASEMSVDKSNADAPSLTATLQVPSQELDAALVELRTLGRVTTESQGGEDVSDQHVDLTARLHNARETEQRLLEILRTRTGKVTDVLQVEEQVSQTRGQIEQMEAQLAGLEKRVSYASVKLQMGEEYKAPAAAANGVSLRLRNAMVGGYRDAVESLISLVGFVFSAGPTLLLWVALLFWPARALWRRRGALRGIFRREAVQ